MIKLLTSNWMTLPVSAIIYLAATVAFWKSPVLTPHSTGGNVANTAGPSWDYHNPEADQLISELHDEKVALDKRKQQLDDLEARLTSEKGDIAAARQSVELLQSNFDQTILNVQQSETGNLKKLAKIYADMTPDNAAAVFANMDDPTVAKILVFMKEPETAGILESLAKQGDAQSKRAAALSERLRLASIGSAVPAK